MIEYKVHINLNCCRNMSIYYTTILKNKTDAIYIYRYLYFICFDLFKIKILMRKYFFLNIINIDSILLHLYFNINF